jgi:N-acetylglucosaminyldiphosphoundecaprenol N-acetyl-beta-D-mannosaminyltransferase
VDVTLISEMPVVASSRPDAHTADCPVSRPLRARVDLFGVPTDALTMDETVDAVRGFLRCGAPHQHVCLNAAKVVELDHRPELASAIAGCSLVSVDGQAVVWASRFLGCPVPERVAGIDLFERLLAEAAEAGLRVYLLGARQDVVDDVVRIATAKFPGLVVAGARNGYWSPDEEAVVVADIAASRADLLFVALPSPRKELFMEGYATELGVPFRMGVGGSFDVMAGRTTRAPRWAQRIGMEWAFRLLQEPRRMARRYLVGNTAFVLLTVRTRRMNR